MKQEKPLRVLWIDDSQSEYEKLKSEFEEDGELHVEFLELDDSGLGFDENYILQQQPDVVLLDWNEGDGLPGFKRIREEEIACVLVSWNSVDEIRLALQGKPELEEVAEYSLQKTFTVFRLKEVIQQARAAMQANNVVQDDLNLPIIQNDEQVPALQLHDLLAIRLLNVNLQAVDKTAGWVMNIDRPAIEFSANEQEKLLAGEAVSHYLFTQYPFDLDKFGQVLFITEELPEVENPTWPASAKYIQRAIPLPPEFGVFEASPDPLQGIFSMMRQAGFNRGRFYHLARIPGKPLPFLELVARFPDEGLPLPVSIMIDDKEYEAYCEYCNIYAKNKLQSLSEELIYYISDQKRGGENDKFWDLYVDNSVIDQKDSRLTVPVFLHEDEQEYGSPLKELRGVLVFDLGGKGQITDKQVKAVDKCLLLALEYFAESRRGEHDLRKQRVAKIMLELHEKLAKAASMDALTQEFIKAMVAVEHFEAADAYTADNAKTPVRSATFAIYKPNMQHLEIVSETDDLMKGFQFPLTMKRFFLVECANKALEKKEGWDLPQFKPHIEYDENTIALKTEDFKEIDQCKNNPELLRRCMDRLVNDVKALVAFPLFSRNELMGVVALRTNRPYEFTLRRVRVLRDVLDLALPYLQKFLDETKHRSVVDGLIMHEMRANLSWALAKMNMISHSQCDGERTLLLDELKMVLQDGDALSSMYLEWLGYGTEHQPIVADGKLWDEIDQYGRFRERSSENKTWNFYNKPLFCSAHDAIQFGRVLRVLIDNAFRYASDGEIKLRITVSDAHVLKAEISNPGKLRSRTGNVLTVEEFANKSSERVNIKPKIGLGLVTMALRKYNMPPPILEMLDESSVRVTLHWPMEMKNGN